MGSGIAGRTHVATLDLLRLVAAISVVLFHYLFRGAAADGFLDQGYEAAAPVALYGYLGVNLFFLISGFVIAWSAEGRAWHDFAFARFARLYPGFLLCMTASAAVLWLAAAPEFPMSFRQFGANLLILAPALGQPFVDGVYWSIVLEIIFYGWVALAMLAGMFQTRRLELVGVWLLACAANEFWIGSTALRLVMLTEYGPLFATGILAHWIFSRGRSAPVLLMLGLAFVLSSANMHIARDWMLAHYGTAIPGAALPCANLLIHIMLFGALRLAPLLRPSPLVMALGGLTYPLYLLHQNIGYVAIDALAPTTGKWAAFALVTLAMLLISWAIWRGFEKPVQRRLKNARARLEPVFHLSGPRKREGRLAAP